MPLFGGDGWEAPELLQIAKEAAEGTYYTTHYSPETQTPEVQNFVKAYRAKYGRKTSADEFSNRIRRPSSCSERMMS